MVTRNGLTYNNCRSLLTTCVVLKPVNSAEHQTPPVGLCALMSIQVPSAAQAVGEYLQSPDDLMKVAAFRKKLEKEKASIDARLKTGVKEQLEATRDGLRKLLGTRTNVQAIKDEMSTVDVACQNPANAISTFDQIARVSMVHRNFEQVEEMVNNLTGMHSKLDMIEEMLYADRKNITGPARNLLTLHFHLNQLENFRNQTMHQAKKARSDSRATLARWFERLDKFVDDFEEYFAALSRNILPIVRAGHPEVVVKLVKIAEIEGKEDEKVSYPKKRHNGVLNTNCFYRRLQFVSSRRPQRWMQRRSSGHCRPTLALLSIIAQS